MNTITVFDSAQIPCGNLGFVYAYSKHQRLQDRCIALEQSLKSDYELFTLNYRMALEEWALCEETTRRIDASGGHYREQTTRERITQEVTQGYTKYAELLIDLCLASPNKQQIEKLINRQNSTASSSSYIQFEAALADHIRSLFRFASKNAHSGEKSDIYKLTNDLCRDYFRKLFYLLSAYYGYSGKFVGSLLPFQNYYPIPKNICEENGIILENRKQIYARQHGQRVEYFLFAPADETISDSQRRDFETIHRLWMENLDSPQNVVSNPAFVSNKNGLDYRYWVYPLPSSPKSLTDVYIEALKKKKKLQIAHGMVRGVASMHHAEPPFYHRALSPSAFLICRIKNRPKPLLINFDCVKDTDEDAAYTVFYAVSDKMNDESMQTIFAPELYAEEILEDIDLDWEKIDIYALGKTLCKILTGSYDLPMHDTNMLSEKQCEMLHVMCRENPADRPSIDQVSNVF